jgi:hypothetical protein
MKMSAGAVEQNGCGFVVDGGLLVIRRAGPLVIHFQEGKIGELLDVVAVRDLARLEAAETLGYGGSLDL